MSRVLTVKASRHRGVTSLDLRMMDRALELARQAMAMDEVPVGAVIYRDADIVSEAFNLREKSHDPVAHAELLAISKAGRALSSWRLTDCTLVVTLEPCPMCAGAIVNSRVGRVIYGATDPKAGACESLYHIPSDRRLNHRPVVIGGVRAEACAELLRDFFRAKREARKAERAAADCGACCAG